jgi:alpha-galactosidase
MVFSGLAARGYSYINIDAGWQGLRGGEFNAIQGNKGFPDMGALCAYVHEKGLRIGIYSTPWVKSYCLKGEGFTGGSSGEMADGVQSPYVSHMKEKKYIGKITYESEDSAQWADWGFDYLKYDWIINDVPSASRMRAALDKVNRDIILSLSNNAPFQNAADWAALANCWRITGDITDTWESLCRNGFGQDKWAPFAGPGHWNDPDMLVLGRIGWGEPRACRLSRDEQITHMTLWSLLSAPLIAGCALSAIDDFTLALLCNDEVIAVNQDSLGFQARQIRDFSSADSGGNPLRHETVYVKKLADKSLAAGLFNRGPEGALIRLDWTELGLPGSRAVRDLWGRKDLGVFERGVELGVPSHGAQMLLIK